MKKLLRDRRGVTTIEYGLIASLISIVGMIAIASVGAGVNYRLGYVSNAIEHSGPGNSDPRCPAGSTGVWHNENGLCY